MNRFKSYIKNILNEDLILKQNFNQINQTCKLLKIELNTCSKTFINNNDNIFINLVGLELIGSQLLKKNRSKKSIANFKLIKKSLIGCQLSLQNEQMYSFIEKLFIFILPHIKSPNVFKKINSRPVLKPGTAKAYPRSTIKRARAGHCVTPSYLKGAPEGEGSVQKLQYLQPLTKQVNTSVLQLTGLTFNIDNLYLFPELQEKYEIIENINKINVNIVTTAKNEKECFLFLTGIGL